MAIISQETIEEVNRVVDIVSLIGEYTKLEPAGGDSFKGCCPFHHEKTPSFHVSRDKKIYHCFGCGVGGNAFRFVEEQEKVGFPEAVEFLAKKFNIPVKYKEGKFFSEEQDRKFKLKQQYIELYERTASMFHYLLTETEQGKSALEYVARRGISSETIKKFRLGYAPKDKTWLKRFLLKKNFTKEFLKDSGLFSRNYPDNAFFVNRLMFPIFDRQGQVVALGGRQLDNNPDSPKYLNSGDLVQYKKGETLYAFSFAKKSIKEKKKVIFCEGYMDCIAYHQCGLEYAVAPLGTSLTEEQIKIIQPFVEEVLLSFDADGAGEKATWRAILMLRKAGLTVRVIKIDGGKDPAELMQNFGKEILTNAVNNAILDSDFLLSRLGAMYPVDTHEGKTRAAQAFFPYIEALRSDMQKESCLDLLSRTFNIRLEAVRKDFQNRDNADNRRVEYSKPADAEHTQKSEPLKLTAELRSVLAVIADLNRFSAMRSHLTENDFDDSYARELYKILEECFSENSLSLNSILNHCNDERLVNLITDVVTNGEFADYTEKAVQDSIRLIKKRSLERQRDKVLELIKTFNPLTEDDKEYMKKLLAEKMEIDLKLRH